MAVELHEAAGRTICGAYIAVSTGQPIDTIAVHVAKIAGDEPKSGILRRTARRWLR